MRSSAPAESSRRKRLRLIALRDAAIVCTLLSTGARVSELIGLTRGAVKQGKAQTAQVTGKGDKRRMVILDDESQRTIQAYLRLRQDTNPALFVSHLNGRRPKGLDAKSVQRVMEHLEESIRKRFPDNPDAQAVRITPHIFRHNVGASLTREGAHPNSIKAYLGHASVQTTEVYQEDAADEQVMDDVATYTPTRRQQIEDAKELLNLNVPENA